MDNTIYIGNDFSNNIAGVCRKIAVLNSHQSKMPTIHDEWFLATLGAVEAVCKNGDVLITSVGLNTYELALWYAGTLGCKQIVVLPLFKNQQHETMANSILHDFNLSADNTSFLFFPVDFSQKFTKRAWKIRDKLIVDLADNILPVSIRDGGFIASLLDGLDKVDNKYCIPYSKSKYKIPPSPTPEQLNFTLLNCDWDYLTHWTHTYYSLFPCETIADYYVSILATKTGYAYSALKSLAHILRQKAITASSNGIRGEFPVVSFSAATPAEALDLMLWRSRKVRYTYEPYGIAIKNSVLQKLGSRPVIYGDVSDFDLLPDHDKPYYQFKGRDNRWTAEQEWRILGDFDFSRIDTGDILIMVRDEAEADELREEFGDMEIVVMCG